jgi:hypothetical protein
MACQEEFFVNYLLDVTENDEHALDFALHLYRLSGLGESGHSVYSSTFLPRTLV